MEYLDSVAGKDILYSFAFVGLAIVLWLGSIAWKRRGQRQDHPPAQSSIPPERWERAAAATRPVTQADRDLAARMIEGMVAQVRHEQDIDEMRGQEPVVVRLAPQIPIREHEAPRSWLGGEPEMPAGADWPEVDGRPAVFLAQVCCADLPADLWDGLGPREGWLAFFLHPEDYRMQGLHLTARGPARPGPALGEESWFNPAGGLATKTLPHAAKRAFPRWPVDVVTVRPGDPDPRLGGDADATFKLYKQGYDLASPEHQPFDWDSTLAMLDIVEERVSARAESSTAHADRLPEQLRGVLQKLKDAEQSAEPPDNLEILRSHARHLPVLIDATDRAREMIVTAAAELQPIARAVRERAGRVPFSPAEVAPLMTRLREIEWLHVRRPTAVELEETVLPLTVHDPDAPLWAADFETLRFDWAKHAYCRSPSSLPPAVRDFYERLWRDLAPHEMAGMGHVPFNYVHAFDPATEVTLIELPSSDLMSWMFGDVDNLVVTMTKADLAAGDFSALKVQVSN